MESSVRPKWIQVVAIWNSHLGQRRDSLRENLLEIIRNAQNLAENLAINLRGGQTHLLSPQRSGD